MTCADPRGKLWMSLGYDQNGFEEGAIEGFWQEVQDVGKEVLLKTKIPGLALDPIA